MDKKNWYELKGMQYAMDSVFALYETAFEVGDHDRAEMMYAAYLEILALAKQRYPMYYRKEKQC